MRLLLDTHIALWATLQAANLPPLARALITDPNNDVAVSTVTVWEIAIKYARRRGHPDDMPVCGSEALTIFEAAGYRLLPVSAAHAAGVDALPRLHGDPFDRMLVTQARLEPLWLITRDKRLADYAAPVTVV